MAPRLCNGSAVTREQLGRPESGGMCLAITRKGMEGLTLSVLPDPDYGHRVYFNPMIGNYIVVRPDNKGNYGEAARDFGKLVPETPSSAVLDAVER